MAASSGVLEVATQPFAGQRPGTSGLRKRVPEFKQPHYLENFTQSLFNVLGDELRGSTLVLSGDGRFFADEAARVIVRMAAANGVGRVIVGEAFLMSTPAVSACIRQRKALGGIILTASHNPGGPEGDFGFKYNISNGGPAPAAVTEAMFAESGRISSYKTLAADAVAHLDVSKPGEFKVGDDLVVEVIDACALYTNAMKAIFDFDALRAFLAKSKLQVRFDAMHGVAGPFARHIFCGELGLPAESVLNGTPLPDFGGGHPDPNLTYAHDLVALMGLGGGDGHGDGHGDGEESKKKKQKKEAAAPEGGDDDDVPDFGAAADGDADRNMILGKRFFVNPSDSVAIIAAHAAEAIPYFGRAETKLTGVARSMPTSQALDRVAEQLGFPCYQVPTGWKFFGTLMESGQVSICGEESFGTSSDHIREKDGLWAVLAWLSILEHANRGSDALVTVQDVVECHWARFGRNYYTRYDYEDVSAEAADKLMGDLEAAMAPGEKRDALVAQCRNGGFELKEADNFSYEDPVDKSVATKQGLRLLFADGSRIVFRKSGTGSVGATIRMYVEKYEREHVQTPAPEALAQLVELAINVSNLKSTLGREKPTVIT